MNILIVEDRLDDRTLLRYALERAPDWRVVEAANGEEALARLGRERADLVIADALLPKMDGFALLQAMKQAAGLADIPFVFYSATYTAPHEQELAMALGAAAFLVKPLPPQMLFEKIHEIVQALPAAPKSPSATAQDHDQERLRMRHLDIVAAKLEEKVRELEMIKETWEKTFNSLTEIVTVQDKDLRILRANAEAGRLFGVDVAELSGKHCYEVFGGSTKPCFNCPVFLSFQDGKSHGSIVRHQGLGKSFHVTTTPVFDQNQQLEYLIHVARDITEEERLEEELRQAHKMEAIGTLAGGIAHDFNNILAAMLGYTELALHKTTDGQTASAYLEEVLSAGQRAKELVKQILSFSRKGDQSLGALQPGPLIKESLKFLRSSLPSSILIKEELDPDSGSIMADPSKIQQVVINLCTNAFQAMENQKGEMAVRLRRRDLGAAELSAHRELTPGPYLELSVQDNGAGIRPEDLPRIFEPYYTSKGLGQGSGLGLAVVHGIVTAMGGLIKVASEEGKGSTFTIYLPLLAASEPAADRSPFGAKARLLTGSERVLVVDDDQTITAMLGGMLERLGYRVTAHSNGEAALNAFRQNADGFDLLITDQTMPGLTGAELTQEIHRLRPDLPVILCTGFSSILDEARALKLGVSRYLNKPVGLQELSTAMRQILDGKRSQDTPSALSEACSHTEV